MYQYRNLPCNIVEANNLWCVVGTRTKNGTEAGILEWCYSQQDAESRKRLMEVSEEFIGLDIEQYLEGL